MRTKKRVIIWICALALLASGIQFPTALAQEEEFLPDPLILESVPPQETENEDNEANVAKTDGSDEESDTEEPTDDEAESSEQENNVYRVRLDSQIISSGAFLSSSNSRALLVVFDFGR